MQKNANQQKLMEQEGFLEKTLKYKRKLLSFFNYKIKDQQDHLHEYDFPKHPGASMMIPVDLEENKDFIKQWQRFFGKILLELPSGTLDPMESKETCAHRELQEETGYFANKLTYLVGFFTAPGFCSEYLHLFLAEDAAYKPLESKDTQFIDKMKLSLLQTLKALDNGEIEDAKTLCKILKYLRHIEKLSY
jgi:ADP-ribose pyrophosphatase